MAYISGAYMEMYVQWEMATLHVSHMAENPDKENSIFASFYSNSLLKSIK